jgi:HEAT repeats
MDWESSQGRSRSPGLRLPVGALMPWLPSMDANGRLAVAAQIGKEPTLTAELRQVLVELLGDRSPHVRKHAIEALGKTRLAPAEAPSIEALLKRSAADIRRAPSPCSRPFRRMPRACRRAGGGDHPPPPHRRGSPSCLLMKEASSMFFHPGAATSRVSRSSGDTKQKLMP